MRAWRALCRNAAQFQAMTDATDDWNMLERAEPPFSHRWEHIQQVVQLALWLAGQTGADVEIVEAAAWLHDIRKTERKHGVVGAAVAARLLAESDFPPHKIDAVSDAIRKHVGLHRPTDAPMEPLEAAVLWDADKMSKLGVQALVMALSAPAVDGMTLAERRVYVEDFTRKVLSRTVDSMNTEPARLLAAQRYQMMARVLDAWQQEEDIGGAGSHRDPNIPNSPPDQSRGEL